MNKHFIIIGGIAAGTKAAAKARRENNNLQISLYIDENYISYSACGLPYFIEDLFSDPKKLIMRTKEQFKEKENIDIFLNHKVIKIIPDSDEIIVKNLDDNSESVVKYSNLLIATGASPFVPTIKGINSKNVFTLRSITDGMEIKEKLSCSKNAVIIGAGYIGMETLEAFVKRGLNTTIIEISDQIMPVFDKDIAQLLESYIKEEVSLKINSKIEILTDDAVNKIITNDKNEVIEVKTTDGKLINADIVLVSTGVRPNIKLAKEVGIEIGQTGAIKVNSRMQTNIKNIYAAGDCVEQTHIITETPVWIPLGTTANKQGRVAAINIAGGGSANFKGVLGSAITKVFDYTMAITGLSEKQAQKENIDYKMVTVQTKDKAGYMPDAQRITIKLLAAKTTNKLIGVQIIGKGDVDKRINIMATALNADMTIEEFLTTDLAYAPPYSTSIDPILKAAQVLGKIM
ncbi:MAG: FAD-dependent oxidoreductase [Candidatus Gastranaerophilaceae bacterium]|jgi:NADPH-dependent 2,4-dienoyl-CoA reductase/sulfur reductase-like enzyme